MGSLRVRIKTTKRANRNFKRENVKVSIMRLTPLQRVYWNIPKGPKAPLYRPFKYFNLAEPEKYGGVGKPTSYVKNLLADAPELFMCGLMAFTGYIIAGVGYYYEQKRGFTRGAPYKSEFIVVRPDDELVNVVIDRNPAYYEDKMKDPKPQWPKEEKGFSEPIIFHLQ